MVSLIADRHTVSDLGGVTEYYVYLYSSVNCTRVKLKKPEMFSLQYL